MDKLKVLAFAILMGTMHSAWGMDWMPNNKIDNLRIDQGGYIYGNTTTNYVWGGCNTDRFTIPSTQAGFKEMYSMLLSALVANKQVNLSLAVCEGNKLIIDGVRINK